MTEMVLTDFFDRAVHIYGDKRAIIDQNDNVYTYKDVNDRVNRLSHGLHSFGAQKGDRVVYLAPNTLEMYEGFYGVFQLGAVMVSLNTRLKSEDYLYILNHSESRVLFVDHELYPLVEPIIPKLEQVQTIVVHGAERSSGAYYSYDDWLANQSKESFQRAEVSENDVCSLLYTSGTTGKPKGVMLTHRNNYLHALSSMHHLRVNDEDTLIHILPMFHVNGWGSPFYYTANGMTESAPLTLASYMSSEDRDQTGNAYYAAKAKQGYEMIGTRVRVFNEHGQDVPADGETVGELVVRGHGVMKGYWKNDEETKNTIRDGWLHTGDMATIDERNRVQIVDRKKDIIISGGENISSLEVEDVFYRHPAVKEAAIVAKPDEKWGETPHAILVLREGHEATEEDMIGFVREHLAHFKCPRHVTFLDELPKTASGKIQKVYLREMV
ncbi:AMP-binding protein [Geomicrobium sp. JCM 19039]|uniref:AMP-binding protein n=1 Tax=Geomicrobium sp. JCM 19039 TaxID=1460636 RepID=UPI00045F1C9D|nr:long-chain-fatty-acid-CoA ligase [Geomicrobium sp. JCM 19039]